MQRDRSRLNQNDDARRADGVRSALRFAYFQGIFFVITGPLVYTFEEPFGWHLALVGLGCSLTCIVWHWTPRSRRSAWLTSRQGFRDFTGICVIVYLTSRFMIELAYPSY